MSTELPNGVVIVDGDDPGSTLGLAYGSSVDNLIGGFTETRQLQTFSWVNAAARNAQTGMESGDLGYQADTGVTYQYDTISANDWAQVLPIIVPAPQYRQVARSANQTIGGSFTATTVAWDTTTGLPDSGDFTVSGNAIVVPEAGVYRLISKYNFSSNGNGNRGSGYTINGGPVTWMDISAAHGTQGFYATASDILQLAAGDAVAMQVAQSSGGSLGLASASMYIEKVD